MLIRHFIRISSLHCFKLNFIQSKVADRFSFHHKDLKLITQPFEQTHIMSQLSQCHSTANCLKSTLIKSLKFLIYFDLIFSFCLIANLIFISTIILMPFNGTLAYEINSNIANLLWKFMQFIFEGLNHGQITFSGDILPENENAIIIANHISYSDFYLINGLALRKGMLPYCRWFAKASLKYQLPIFGLSMYLIGMVMITRDWLKDSNSIRKAFAHLKDPIGIGKKIWLVSFVEGTRITPEKLLQSQAYCQSKSKPVLTHLLAPRTKGFVAAVQELRGSQVTHVYDLTLAYRGPKGFNDPSSLITVHSTSKLSPTYSYHVHVRRYALNELPATDAEITNWLERIWKEKDDILNGLNDHWINWEGLVGNGAKSDSLSGAYGVYRQGIW